eukprot:748604-Amphidinium_carterae.1
MPLHLAEPTDTVQTAMGYSVIWWLAHGGGHCSMDRWHPNCPVDIKSAAVDPCRNHHGCKVAPIQGPIEQAMNASTQRDS